MIFGSQEQLDACLAYWQKVLRLQDWRIYAKIERADDMPEPVREGREAGHVVMEQGSKYCEITLLDPLDYYKDRMEPHDQEKILVHEMLHLYEDAITRFMTDDERETAYFVREQFCESLARSFILLNRK